MLKFLNKILQHSRHYGWNLSGNTTLLSFVSLAIEKRLFLAYLSSAADLNFASLSTSDFGGQNG